MKSGKTSEFYRSFLPGIDGNAIVLWEG